MRKRIESTIRVTIVFAASLGSGAPVIAQHSDFSVTTIGQFDEPWALEFLPDGRLLNSKVGGTLKVLNANGEIGKITGVPEVSHRGQGGFGDVVLHPHF